MFGTSSRPVFRWLMAALLLLQWNAAGAGFRTIDESRSAAAKAGASDSTLRLPRASLPNENLKSALREFSSGNLDGVLAAGPAILPVAQDFARATLFVNEAPITSRHSFDSRAPPPRV